jgi:hypothetical protein
MKRLRKFAIGLDQLTWGPEVGYPFYLASRPLCNFIERGLRTKAVYLVASSKLVIVGSSSELSNLATNGVPIAVLSVPFDLRAYAQLVTIDEKNSFMVEFSTGSLRASPDLPQDQVSAMVEMIQGFRDSGYINEWRAAVRSLPERGLKADLHCAVTGSEFTLTLRVFKTKELVFTKVLLHTDSDELSYHHRFKDIEVSGEALFVTARNGAEPLAQIPFKEILKSTAVE